MPFIGDSVKVEAHADGRTWVVLEPLRYRGRDELLTVPEGSTTDFASVPDWLTWLVPKTGIYTRSAILHDHLWRHGGVSRADADGIFRRSMRELGVPLVHRWLMWCGVRAASAFRPRPGEPRASAALRLALAGVALVMLPLVALPALFMLPALLALRVAEAVAARAAKVYFWFRPGEAEPVNPASLLGPLRRKA